MELNSENCAVFNQKDVFIICDMRNLLTNLCKIMDKKSMSTIETVCNNGMSNVHYTWTRDELTKFISKIDNFDESQDYDD